LFGRKFPGPPASFRSPESFPGIPSLADRAHFVFLSKDFFFALLFLYCHNRLSLWALFFFASNRQFPLLQTKLSPPPSAPSPPARVITGSFFPAPFPSEKRASVPFPSPFPRDPTAAVLVIEEIAACRAQRDGRFLALFPPFPDQTEPDRRCHPFRPPLSLMLPFQEHPHPTRRKCFQRRFFFFSFSF